MMMSDYSSLEMRQSSELNELLTALSKAQGELRNAEKDTQGYGYKYAELSQIIDLARPILVKHGLSITQHPYSMGDHVGVRTRLGHSSGQWLESGIQTDVQVQGKQMRIQAAGSHITYLRRYAYSAILGIATEEDTDGVAKTSEKRESGPAFESEPVAPMQRTVEELTALADELGVKYDIRMKWLELAKVKSMKELKNEQVNALYAKLIEKKMELANV